MPARPAVRPRQQGYFEDLQRRAEAALDSRPEEAAGLYKQALAIRPEWAEGWLYMGGALYQKPAATPKPPMRCGKASGWRRPSALGGLSWASASPNWKIETRPWPISVRAKDLGLGGNPRFEAAVRVRAAVLLIRVVRLRRSSRAVAAAFQGFPTILLPWRKPWDLSCSAIPAELTQLSPQKARGRGPGGKGRLGFRQPASRLRRRPRTGN